MMFRVNKQPLVGELVGLESVAGEFLVTSGRRLLGCVELSSGIDPSPFDAGDHLRLARAIDSIFGGVPDEITVTQTRICARIPPVTFQRREDPLADRLRLERQRYLSRHEFLHTRILHWFDIALDDALDGVRLPTILRNVVLFPFSRDARAGIRNALSNDHTVRLLAADLAHKSTILTDALEVAAARWSSLTTASILSPTQMLAAIRLQISPESAMHDSGLAMDLDDYPDLAPILADGDISRVQFGGVECLRLDGVAPIWVRAAALVNHGLARPGYWATGATPPLIDLPFPHTVSFRWRRLSGLQTSLLFETKRRELQRSSTSLSDLLKGINSSERPPEHLSSRMRARFAELDSADALDVQWTSAECYILIWSDNAETLSERARTLHSACQAAGGRLVWESSALATAWSAALPTGSGRGIRRLITNSAQNASLAIVHARATGPTEEGGEEPLDVFPTADRGVFRYFARVGGRGLAIGIGPTRSGKTYLKNLLALQSRKYEDSRYFAFDIDPGTELLAELLADDAAYFAIGDQQSRAAGFNLFASARGPNDAAWADHWIQQLDRMFFAGEDTPLTTDDRETIDRATRAVLESPADQRSLSHFAAHLPRSISQRLSRWLRADPAAGRERDGVWSYLVDQPADAYITDARFVVFNFAALRDSETARQIAYAEIFYRVAQVFEDETCRGAMKFLDIDEAHVPLSDPAFCKWLVRGARTWNKWRVTVSLWSQTLAEFSQVDGWEALRSAAGTLMFTAQPNPPETQYREVLGLTSGEISAIASLVPRREIYVIQREAGVSRRADVRTDAWTDLLLRSDPETAAARRKYIVDYGLVAGLDRLAQDRAGKAAPDKAA